MTLLPYSIISNIITYIDCVETLNEFEKISDINKYYNDLINIKKLYLETPVKYKIHFVEKLEEKINQNLKDYEYSSYIYLLHEKLKNIQKIKYLIKKYNCYNDDYEDYETWQGIKIIPKAPFLLDACFTGCQLPFCQHSENIFKDEIFQDIKDIIQLIPEF